MLTRAIGVCVLSALTLAGVILGGCRSTCCRSTRQSQPLEVYAQKRAAGFTKFAVQQSASAEQRRMADRNCPDGVPRKKRGFGHGRTEIVYYENFVAEVSLTEKVPLWVCERVTRDQLSGPGNRDFSSFKPDAQLGAASHPLAKDRDYVWSGFDRGHQAPAANHKKSQLWMDNTHFFSNIAPQDPEFNRLGKIWETLEGVTRSWVRKRELKNVHIITGGFFYDPEEEDPSTADGLIEYRTIGPGQVSVPTHYYKIVVGVDQDDVRKAVAYVFENRGYSKPYNWQTHVKPVRWVEERAGLNFMPDLSSGDAADLEGTEVDLSQWPR